METVLLNTAQLASLAGVATTSVKRWADEGLLPCSKTPGGHRRFKREDVVLIASRGTVASGTAQSRNWIALMGEPQHYLLLAKLFEVRAQLGSWHAVADSLGPSMIEIGLLWRRGQISIIEEHQASERLHRALAQVATGLTVAEEAPLCLLATAPGDDHTLGLSLAEICLAEAGWRALWLGRGVPVADMASLVSQGRTKMVALSASRFTGDSAVLRKQITQLASTCARHGTRLILGGSGEWPSLANANRIHRFSDFAALLSERS